MTDMRTRLAGYSILAAISGLAAFAQEQQDDSAAGASSAERLAWSIQTYAPCDWTSSLGSIEVEIAASGASTSGIGQALSLILGNAAVCDPVKDASARLLARLPEDVPETEESAAVEDPIIAEEPVSETVETPPVTPPAAGSVSAPAMSSSEPEELAASIRAAEYDAQPIYDAQPMAEQNQEYADMLYDPVPDTGRPGEAPANPAELMPVADVPDVSFKVTPPPRNPAYIRN